MTSSVTVAKGNASTANTFLKYDLVKISGIAPKQSDQIYIYGKDNTQQDGGVLLGTTAAAPVTGPFSADAASYVFTTLIPSNLYSAGQIVVYDASSNKVLSPTVTVTPGGDATGIIGSTGNIAVGFQVTNNINIIGGAGNIAVGIQLNNQVNIAVLSSGLTQGGAQTNINNAGNLVIGTAGSIAGPGTTGGSGLTHTSAIVHTRAVGHNRATTGSTENVGGPKSNLYSHQKATVPVNKSTLSHGDYKPSFLSQPVGSTGSTGTVSRLNHPGQATPSVLSFVNTSANLKNAGFLKTPTNGQNTHSAGAIVPGATSHVAAASMFPVHGNDPHAIIAMLKLG